MKADEGHRKSEHVYRNLVLAPFVGLAYVIALPFIAVGTVVGMVGKKVLKGVAGLAGNLISFGWRPLEAHLAGKKKKEQKKNEK